MAESIEQYRVYTTVEAAKLLKVSVATVQRYIRGGKIKAKRIGDKWYRLTGESLLDFMGLTSPKAFTPQRIQLLNDLSDSMTVLYPLVNSELGNSMDKFLHRMIENYVDEVTIKKILVDMNKQIQFYKEQAK